MDDTGFFKQGKHAVGGQRQYTGSAAGTVPHCQLGVSLGVATHTEHLPLDFELYLPEGWAHDEVRRHEARIPADVPSRPSAAFPPSARGTVEAHPHSPLGPLTQ